MNVFYKFQEFSFLQFIFFIFYRLECNCNSTWNKNVFKCNPHHPFDFSASWQMIYRMTHPTCYCSLMPLHCRMCTSAPLRITEGATGLLLICWHSLCSHVLRVLQEHKQHWKVMSRVTFCLELPVGAQLGFSPPFSTPAQQFIVSQRQSQWDYWREPKVLITEAL